MKQDRIKIGDIKKYDNKGSLIGIRPYWVCKIREYKTPLIDFLIHNIKPNVYSYTNSNSLTNKDKTLS